MKPLVNNKNAAPIWHCQMAAEFKTNPGPVEVATEPNNEATEYNSATQHYCFIKDALALTIPR